MFIAIELPDNLLRAIEKLQNSLKRATPGRAAKWVSPEGIHLTLKFLGDVQVSRIDEVVREMQAALEGHQSFYLNVEGLGCFPNLHNPRVLWLGLTGGVRELAALQNDIEQFVAPLGFPTEDRPFHPHLTLARTAREASRDEITAIGQAAERGVGTLGGWRVDGVSLMRSQLRPSGAVYTQEAEVLLS
jgi:2'-5' RNA ligase